MAAAVSKRIALVTDELLGLSRSAGAGTANTFLTFALADMGHDVAVLFSAPMPPDGIAEPWRSEYERRGIEVRSVAPFPHPVSPKTATVTCAVQEALHDAGPDVVVADDRYGSCYASLRTRSLGLGFPNTVFVIYCHGTTAWISEAHRKVRRWPAAFEVEALERGAIELADVVVSPSAYMLDWMRRRGWNLPRALVAPLLTRSAVDPDLSPERVASSAIRRVAFFGRLEERKGLRPFVDAINAIDPNRLAGVELLFVGRDTPAWTAERVRAALSSSASAALATVRFETDLDQPEAIALLKDGGTLAVMPSLVDNSPMVIYECLEHGIPFLASSAGGGHELVAEEDRDRMFTEPTADGLARRLSAVLSDQREYPPARPAFETEQTLNAWRSALASTPSGLRRQAGSPVVTALVRRRGSEAELERCLAALKAQSRPPNHVLVGERLEEAGAAAGDLLFLLEDVDQPEQNCLERLLTAQAASDADVVTCAFQRDDGSDVVSFFLGDARELGVLANHYGLAGLFRRSVFEHTDVRQESEWLALVTVALADGRIVSVPQTLIRSSRTPENVALAPKAALAVVAAFENASPHELRGLPTLAASFAARTQAPSVGAGGPGLLRRLRRRAMRARAARG